MYDIGIFDSGVGGLQILKEIVRRNDNISYLYIGDTKNLPYGTKSREEITANVEKVIRYFVNNNIKIIIFACNTASAACYDEMLIKYPSINFIEPIATTVDYYADTIKENILILATKFTTESQSYANYLKLKNISLQIYQCATVDWCDYIESGDYLLKSEEMLSKYLLEFKGKIKNVLLGCTHYPIIQSQISNFFDRQVNIYNSNVPIAEKVLALRKSVERTFLNLENKIYLTDLYEDIDKRIRIFLEKKDIKIKLLNL